MRVFLPKFGRFIGLRRVEYLGTLCVCLLLLVSSCSKEFINPYDPATRKDEWMPRDFRLDTLGINSLHLHWQQDNRHIDGYVVQKYVNGVLKEYLVFRDTIDFVDSNAVEANIEATCPEIRYEVVARAGRNRSDAVGIKSPIYMPLSVPAYAGEDVLITDTATTIQLNAVAATAGEAGRWSIVSGSGGSFANDRQHNTSFTGTPCNAYVLRWTKQGCTETFDEVSLSFYPSLTIASAGSDQIFTNSTTQTTLNANAPGLEQTGLWTIVSGDGGTFTDATVPNTTFSGQSCTEYVLKWTISGTCGSSQDNMLVKFMKATTTANAGSNQTINTDAVLTTLSANAPATGEIGTWSIITGSGCSFSDINAQNTQFTGQSCSNYSLRWTVQGQCSSTIDDVTIAFQKATTSPNAGPDQLITSNSTSITLAANNPSSGETVAWSIISGSGGSFSNINAPNATFTGSSCTSYTLRWIIQGLCSTSTNDVNITFQNTAAANAGPNQTPTTNVITLAANLPSNGAAGMWSIISGTGGSFSNPSLYNSSFTGALGQSYTLRWSVTACNVATDDVTITFPEAMAGNGVTDIDGNNYPTTIIGTQEWMGSNLKTTRFANGASIPLLTIDWYIFTNTSPAFGYYDNNSSYNTVYGKLYNWYTASDTRNVCPAGWHVPSKAEWDVLFNYIGENNGVGKLKQTGTTNWLSPNTGATNSVGFNAVPGGFRLSNISGDIGERSYYLSTTTDINQSDYAELERMDYNLPNRQNGQSYKQAGYSIRCLKN
jgi:uncharacterized protein (TIGR02145 family)